jgi:ABC-2 type transport system permease protein
VPPLAIALVEKIAFNTTHFAMFLQHRLGGGEEGAKYIPGTMSIDPLAMLNPAHFLASPGLWGGFVVAAAFLFAAVRLRRYRGPI